RFKSYPRYHLSHRGLQCEASLLEFSLAQDARCRCLDTIQRRTMEWALCPFFICGFCMRNEELTQLLAPVIADLGLECVGVEYSPSHGNSLVRVYIEAPDRPVAVDDCEVVSRQVSASLDVHDPIEGRYTLEVSSP